MIGEGTVLFFDGVCNLCNAAVQFVIRHDKKGVIRFASLQSDRGKAALEAVSGQRGVRPDSLIFFEKEKYFIESDAALRVARYLDGGWKALAWLRIFPKGLRDAVYRLIARNRYRWFGKKQACMIPTAALRARFLG